MIYDVLPKWHIFETVPTIVYIIFAASDGGMLTEFGNLHDYAG